MTTRTPVRNIPATKSKASVKQAPVSAARARPLATPKAAASASPEGRHKTKEKLVRDSFTMPRNDFELIAVLKERALGFRRPTKKSEVLRAGLRALATMSAKQLQQALDSLPLLKSGRPKKLQLTPPAKAIGVT
jgi:hypothetical protein